MPPIERLYGSTDCARRREEEGRTVGEASVCGGFSGAAYAGCARCRRRLADGAGFEPAKHEACVMLARLASGCLRPLGQPSRIREKPRRHGQGFFDTPITRDSVTRFCLKPQTSPAVAVTVAWIAHGISHRAMGQAANTTHEPMMAISMSMTPPFCGAPTRTRTEDPWFKRPLLCQLSYRG